MTLKDASDLFLNIVGEIRFYWNFYVVTVIALMGWFVSTKNSVSISIKILSTTGYMVFAGMNILGLYSSYTLAEALRMDLLSMEGASTFPHTYEVIQATSLLQQRTATLWIHLVLGLAVLSVIWFGQFGQRSKNNRSSTGTVVDLVHYPTEDHR